MRDLPSIETRNLTKVYNGNIVAVDNVSFEIDQGEIFGFLGPNGAGKTTTIKMLTTLTKPTEGQAIVGGIDVVKKPREVRKVIGVVPQQLTVDDDLTGVQNLMLMAKLHRVPDIIVKERVKELLDLVELTSAARRDVKTYSGGMRKRLELVIGLIHHPKILFLDEPTLGLDIQTRTTIWDYIRTLNHDNSMTIFLTTHYLDEADALCDRIGIIDHGKMITIGSPQGLKDSLGVDIVNLTVETDSDNIADALASLPFVSGVKHSGDEYRVKVHRGEEVIATIIEHANKMNVKIKRVTLEKPSLDQVFLELTGRALRYAEEGSTDARVLTYNMKRLRD